MLHEATNNGLAFGRYLPLQGPSHRRRRHILFFALGVLCVFLACIPAIVIPIRQHHHHSLSTSVENSTDHNSSPAIITVPIVPVSFSPFPVPSDTPIPGVFPETSVSNPPTVEEAPGLGGELPDFGQAWKTAKSKATAMLESFTLEEKVALTTGVGWMGGRCVGNIGPVANFPGLCLEVCHYDDVMCTSSD